MSFKKPSIAPDSATIYFRYQHHFKQHQLYLPLCHKLLFTYILGEEYIKSLIANPELVDRLALSNEDKVNT